MRLFRWSRVKNERLRRERDISFEAVVVAIEAGNLLDVLQQGNPDKYPGQRVMVVNVDGYACLVFEDGNSQSEGDPPLPEAKRDMKKPRTTVDEKIAADFERGLWQSVPKLGPVVKRLRSTARATLTKDARINIRLSTPVLKGLQARAQEEGLPYQTLIASVLHKYALGRLVERPIRTRGR